MKNNGTFLGFASIALVLALFVAVPAAQTTSPTSTATDALSLMNLQVSPIPVVAGDNITVSFQLFNSYSASLSQVNLQLMADNPIINVSPSFSNFINTIGTGEYGGYGNDYFTYKLHVPSTLPAGEYIIDVVAQYQTTEGSGAGTAIAAQSVMPIDIYVYGSPQMSLNLVPSGQIVPGRDFTATITAVNSGTDTARNVTVQVLNSTSFTADGPSLFYLGILAPGGSASATASIFAYESVSGGQNYLKAKIDYQANSGTYVSTTANVPINILLNTPVIEASVVSATPAQLLPGGNQTISVLVQNIGTGLAENLSLSYLNGTGVSASGAASYFFVGSLAAGSSVTQSLFISANHNANQSSYSLPVRVMYQYENYQGNVTKTIYVPIRLQSGAVFNVTSVSSSVGIGASYKAVTFRVKNVGNEQATGITLSLQTVYPVTPTTPDAYVTSLSPGQAANVTFYVNVDSSGNAGQYPVTLYEQWRQPNGAANQQYSGSSNYYVDVSGGSGYGWAEGVAAIAIVAIICFVIYKKRIQPCMKKKGINSKK
jgi:hypothetical protein